MKPVFLFLFVVGLPGESANAREKNAALYRRVPVPKLFLITEYVHTFGGDIRIGDLNGDSRCDVLVYRSNHSGHRGRRLAGFEEAIVVSGLLA